MIKARPYTTPQSSALSAEEGELGSGLVFATLLVEAEMSGRISKHAAFRVGVKVVLTLCV